MKRIIAIILSVICVFGLCAMSVSAAEPVDTKHALFEARVKSIYDFLLITGFEGFDETTLTESMVITYVGEECRNEFKQYVRQDETYEEGISESYYVPDTVFESVAAKYFVLTDSLISKMHNHHSYITEGENHYYVIQYIGGAGGGEMTIPNYYGYVDLGDNTFMVYVHLVNLIPLENTENLIEGKDYVMDVDEYDTTAGLVPFAIEGYRTMKVKLDGDNLLAISYSNSTYDAFTSANITKPVIEVVNKDVVYDVPDDVVIDGGESFEGGTTVTCETVVSGVVYERATQALDGKVNKCLVFELTAEKDNVSVQPNGKVYVTFDVPEDYDGKVVVYYVDTDGNVSEIPSVYDEKAHTVTAELTHFSTYVVANVTETDTGNDGAGDGPDGPVEDENKPTNPDDEKNPDDTNIPEPPKTGDNTNIGWYVVTMVLALIGLGALTIKKRR